MGRFVFAILVLGACASHVQNSTVDGGGSGTGIPCTGSETKCEGSSYLTCVNGSFQSQTCSSACTPALGCVDCDPASGNACMGNDVVACNADGTFGTVVMTCGAGTMCGAGGTCANACTADGVDLVYVVDEQNHFMSFDPRKLPGDPLTIIGTLNCPNNGTSIQQPAGGAAMPFSMSVDRDGVAWVLYTTGELFNVSLQNAACTKANNTISASNMHLFGMGFSTDTPGANTEKLFLAGGQFNAATSPRQLAYDDTHNNNLTPVVVNTIAAASDYAPELTGTNEAKLYGFFPRINTPAYVQEINKTDGSAVGTTWNLGTTGLGGNIRDWAFAQWGGTFYVFVTTEDIPGSPNSTIRAINRTTNAYSIVKQNLPYNIDGAGVSTCAPVVIQ